MAGVQLKINGVAVNADGTITITLASLGAGAAASLGTNVAGGVPVLDSNGLLPAAQLPPLAITSVQTVASQAAMLALTAQQGDVAIRTDMSNSAFMLTASDPTQLSNWTEIGQGLAVALQALSGITPAAGTMPYFTGSGTAASTPLSEGARAFLGMTTATQMLSALKIGTGDTPTFAGVNIGTDQTVTAPNAGQAITKGYSDRFYVSQQNDPYTYGLTVTGWSTYFETFWTKCADGSVRRWYDTEYLDATNVGKPGTTDAVVDEPKNASDWVNLPVGYHGLLADSSFSNPDGNYGYFHKIHIRDSSNGYGWGGIYVSYDLSKMFYGGSVVGTDAPTWKQLVDTSFLATNYVSGVGGPAAPRISSLVLSGGRQPALSDSSGTYYNLLTQAQIQSVITGFTTDSALNPSTSGEIFIGSGKGGNVWIGTKDAFGLLPLVDASSQIGSGFQRWTNVFATTGMINTSDAREKTAPLPFTDAEAAAAVDLAKNVQTYKWLSSVEAKGTDARTHIGMTVQQAIAIMQSHGLDPFAYGFICYDKWDAQAEVKDEDGNVTTHARDAGDRYSFRMDELGMFIARGQQQIMQDHADQLTALVARVAALEAK